MLYKIEATEEKVKEGLNLIINSGGEIYGENLFEIHGVEGNFDFSNGVLTVTILKKPWIVSADRIKSKLDDFFE